MSAPPFASRLSEVEAALAQALPAAARAMAMPTEKSVIYPQTFSMASAAPAIGCASFAEGTPVHGAVSPAQARRNSSPVRNMPPHWAASSR